MLMPNNVIKDKIAHEVVTCGLMQLYLDRGISHSDITKILNEYGHLTTTGRSWTAANVSAYIARKVNI